MSSECCSENRQRRSWGRCRQQLVDISVQAVDARTLKLRQASIDVPGRQDVRLMLGYTAGPQSRRASLALRWRFA